MSRKLLLCGPLIVFGIAFLADPSDAAPPVGAKKTNHVSIETPAGGEPMLVIRYPWTLHKKPSIEVRTFVPGEEESVRIRPLQFRSVFMKDTVTIKVYETQAASAATRTTAEFLRHGIAFAAIGERNLLGRPAVCVTCQTEVLKPNKEPFPNKARWALYPFMEPWAVNDETVFLSLPKITFTEPAKIRVFFLRDRDVAWSQTLQWPGFSKPETPAE